VATGLPAKRCFGREVATQGKTRDLEHDREDENGERNHEDCDLRIRLGRKVRSGCRCDASNQGSYGAGGDQNREAMA
jgi:hypothetical protein